MMEYGLGIKNMGFSPTPHINLLVWQDVLSWGRFLPCIYFLLNRLLNQVTNERGRIERKSGLVTWRLY